MAASLSVTSLNKTDVIVVPTRAIETIGLRKFATLQKADGSGEKVEVETGVTNGNDTEIVSGLRVGDKILINR
jgi:multidrug efflux pump subunit AcrA (membrane-fusion protein)